MKTVLAVTLGFSLLPGCESSKRNVIVVSQNQYFECESSKTIETEMIRLINKARSSKRRCGLKRLPAANPMKWNSNLAKAALKHSIDMANHDFLGHRGSNGSWVTKRVEEEGYTWSSVGENISGGRESSKETIQAWLASPDHCANIMASFFTEIGAACFRNPSSKYGTYWTLVLASPKEQSHSDALGTAWERVAMFDAH
ncbi:MAG: CAP domain-containing protein [Proteobacteria bacterium]|nr:CAP domain-containing protein [Pseudomonadota bacterium]